MSTIGVSHDGSLGLAHLTTETIDFLGLQLEKQLRVFSSLYAPRTEVWITALNALRNVGAINRFVVKNSTIKAEMAVL